MSILARFGGQRKCVYDSAGFFGGARAAFAISMLVASYGAVQAVISPAIGAVVDAYGYAPVCVAASAMPLAAYAVLRANLVALA